MVPQEQQQEEEQRFPLPDLLVAPQIKKGNEVPWEQSVIGWGSRSAGKKGVERHRAKKAKTIRLPLLYCQQKKFEI